MARLPQPPFDKDLTSLHRSLTDVISFLRETFDQGAKHPGFSQAQIDSFTDLSFKGTILYNNDTGESNVSFLNGNTIDWRTL